MEIYELQSLSTVGSTRKLAPDWLHKSEQPIRSQVSKLTQLLTLTATYKFSLQVVPCSGLLGSLGEEYTALTHTEPAPKQSITAKFIQVGSIQVNILRDKSMNKIWTIDF